MQEIHAISLSVIKTCTTPLVSGKRVSWSYEMHILAYSIHSRQYVIPATSSRKAWNKVHRNVTPDLGRGWERLQKASWCQRLVFISLAHMTVCYKPLNVLHHTPPVKNCCNYFECAKHPHMTSHGMAVVWNSCRYPRRISRACYDRIVFFLP